MKFGWKEEGGTESAIKKIWSTPSRSSLMQENFVRSDGLYIDRRYRQWSQ